MSDATLASPKSESGKGKRKGLLPIALALGLLGAGFASTYLGFWSPMSLIKPPPSAESAKVSVPETQFVSLPQIVVTLAGPDRRTLVMSIKIETDSTHSPMIEHLIPRLSDAFNSFLAEVDPSAFERRGILDITRDELATRAVLILGKGAFSDILITEFRIQ